jgi:hypothetical protein
LRYAARLRTDIDAAEFAKARGAGRSMILFSHIAASAATFLVTVLWTKYDVGAHARNTFVGHASRADRFTLDIAK